MANESHTDKIIQEFVIEPAVVGAGEQVTLGARLAIPFSELDERRLTFRFTGPDPGSTVPHVVDRERNVAVATWIAAGSRGIEERAFQAQISQQRKVIEQEERRVTVISSADLEIESIDPDPLTEGDAARVEVGYEKFDLADLQQFKFDIAWFVDGRAVQLQRKSPHEYLLDSTGLESKTHMLTAKLVDSEGRPVVANGQEVADTKDFRVTARPLSRLDTVKVSLQRSSAIPTRDQTLWALIRDRTLALSFSERSYKRFVDDVLCDPGNPRYANYPQRLIGPAKQLGTHAYGLAAYELMKTATEVFLLMHCGVATAFADEDFDADAEAARGNEVRSPQELKDRLANYFHSGRLPYLDRVVDAVFPAGNEKALSVFCPNALTSRVSAPCLLELIWSYWHEEGMLVQTMNAISRRFQNMRAPGDRDPLAHLEIDPLRPLNNLLWGYIQDETNLLTVKRRAYEYDHHYGLTLYGKAVPTLRPADSRSKFLEAFHNLLHMTAVFYKEDNDTTVIADGFPLLNALREVHLLLAQGAHNQFGDLPWTARAEMLMQQWILARPEMREFLQSRPMVPYKEGWMSQVDTMKTLQGWSDVTVTHFRDLGVYGEQILLTIRYGDWIDVNDENSAKNWARYWRPEIQGYLHAYRAVTGVDLTNPEGVDYTMPALHLQKRLAMQRTR